MLPTPLAVRLARRLHAAWAARPGPAPGDPADDWPALDARLAAARTARRRLHLAARAGLALILPRLAAELAARLDDVARAVADLRAERTPPPPAPDPAAFLAELRQVEAELGGLDVRWADGAVRATTTEPVALDGVDLGRFAVDFHWTRVGRREGAACFDVVALDPHPAAGHDGVVHPHVRDAELCPGEASAPLRRAVAAGRLADAFLLVRSVLMTYNPASPHVPLAGWHGMPCSDCGRRVEGDDRFSCDGCEADLCEGCAGSCGACSETRCDGCLAACGGCRAACCPGCLEDVGGRAACPDCRGRCSRCGATVRADELTAEGTPCPACNQEDDIDDVEDDNDVAAATGGVGVPPDPS